MLDVIVNDQVDVHLPSRAVPPAVGAQRRSADTPLTPCPAVRCLGLRGKPGNGLSVRTPRGGDNSGWLCGASTGAARPPRQRRPVPLLDEEGSGQAGRWYAGTAFALNPLPRFSLRSSPHP